MKRKIGLILAIVILFSNTFAYGIIGIEDNLRSYILGDAKTGQILEEHNIDEVVEIASITKIMSYIVVMDAVKSGDISLEDVVVIDEDTIKVKGSSFKLKLGEKFTVKELLEASLIVSGNDATYALSKHIAGTEKNFAKMMNEKAKDIGLVNAKFYNSTGLPIYPEDVQNVMTTRELFELSKYIIVHYPDILDISRLKAISMASRNFFQWNSNPLIPKISEVDGLKTGFTNKAGYCHVSTFKEEARKGEREELRLISIVMGARELDTRNKMSEILVKYGLNNYSKKVFLDNDVPIEKLYFEKGEVQEINVYPKDGFSRLTKKDEDISVEVDIRDDLKLPLKKDETIGSVKIIKSGEVLNETDIIVKESFRQARWYTILARKIRGLFN